MTSDPPRGRRALVIGIDRYASDSVADLSGCVNDARLMRALLEDKYRIPAANVRFLADEDATRTRILEAFDGLIEETSPGDMVVVFYAGHGSRVADRDLDEADGHDSTIVPSDAVRWSQPDEFADHPEVLDITDDEIHAKLLRLGERTHNITMIFDCCHSGTISRGGDLVARAVPADRRPAQLLEPLRLSPEDRAALERSRQRSGSGWRSPQGHYVLIAGCRDTELSYEHEVGGHSPPVKHGALTWFLHQALLHAAPGATYRDVFDEVAVQVTSAARAKSASQHPQIEGAEHRLLFDTEEIEPLAFVKVADRQGAQVTLAGGAAHGLQVGSVWAVHPAGTREATEASQLGTLRVTRVGAVQSFADVEGDDAGAIAAGAWAVEVARDFGDRRLRVRMLGAGHEDPAAWTEMARRLDQERRLLERVEDGESVKVVLVAGEPPAELSGLPRLDGPHWVVVSEGGEFMMPPKPADERGAAQVVENLRLWSRYRFTLAIDNPGSRVAREVRVDLVRQAADGSWAPVVPADGESLPALTAGERIDIRLVHTGLEKIWVTGFDFRMTGEVVPILSGVWLHPSSPQNPWVSLTAGQGTTVSWEDGFPYGANPWVASPQEGIEVLKFFLTRQETDLDVSQRAASRGGTSPLAELLASPAAASRGLTLVPADDWGTVSVGFVLRAPEEIAAEPVVEAARVQAEAAPEPERAERPTSGASDTTTAAGPSPSTASPRRQNGATSPSAFPPSDSPAGRLQALMAEHGFVSADRFPVESGTGSRGAPIEYVAPDAEEGWSELLLTTDDRGLVRWHLPEPGLSSARGADPAAEGTRGRRYRIAAPPPAAVPEDARGADGRDARGAVGALAGKLLVDRVLFPLAEPLIGNAVARWETRRRPGRWMWMDADGDAATVRPVQAEEWP
ncbi:MAG: caspase family protein, partial [Gemmatimonadetes bacterium]|nr:caspase family protein [Gemmatimonadota bacterium]